MSTAAYIRVSTHEQNEASQRREIGQWLTGNGITDAVYYADQETGDNLDRPNFQRMQADIFSGKISTVVVYKLDRISRTMRDGLTTLCAWCDRNLRVVAVSQQIDFSGIVGKMIAAVLFGVAEMEQQTRRERQAAGIAAAKEAGVYRGRQPGSLKADHKRTQALRIKGLTDGEIASALGVSRRTVQRYLRQPARVA